MNKTLLSTAIAMALGLSAQAWANPTNNATKFDNDGDASQTATADSNQSGQSGAAANEYSQAYKDTKNRTATQTGNTGATANDDSSATQYNDSYNTTGSHNSDSNNTQSQNSHSFNTEV